MPTHTIYSHILGRDEAPVPVSQPLQDWFGLWLAQNVDEHRPRTFRDLLEKVLPRHSWVPFAIGDGTYQQYTDETHGIPRDLRFTVICTPRNPTQLPSGWAPDALPGGISGIREEVFRVDTVCVVGSRHFDSPEAFLQVASWDAIARRFNFYEAARERRGYDLAATSEGEKPAQQNTREHPVQARQWLYRGSSFDAFSPDTERQGPFCGHVNGALIMKEINNPWRNWQSSRHKMSPTFAPDDPIRTERLLQPRESPSTMTYVADGDQLELIVENSIIYWYRSRSDNDFGPRNASPTQKATRTDTWIRHLLTTTTVNIAGSTVNTAAVIHDNAGTFTVPADLFVSRDVLRYVGRLVLPAQEINFPAVTIRSSIYTTAIQNLKLCTFFRWANGEKGIASRHEGQTPWAVIVPSREDHHGIMTIFQRRLLSTKEIASLLMIDFPNPVYSHRRARLLQYAPTEAYPSGDPEAPYTFGTVFLDAIKASPEAQNPSSPEWEYIRNLEYPDPYPIFAGRISAYLQKLSDRLTHSAVEAVEDYLKLAESRRRLFRPYPSSCDPSSNPLNEFQMTLPYVRAMAQDHEYLEMRQDATIGAISPEGHQFLKDKLRERFKNTPRNCHSGE